MIGTYAAFPLVEQLVQKPAPEHVQRVAVVQLAVVVQQHARPGYMPEQGRFQPAARVMWCPCLSMVGPDGRHGHDTVCCTLSVSQIKWGSRCSTHSTFVSGATWRTSNQGPRGDRGSGPISAITIRCSLLFEGTKPFGAVSFINQGPSSAEPQAHPG